jgi:hypothetical protein
MKPRTMSLISLALVRPVGNLPPESHALCARQISKGNYRK